jgi:hypothetical protein
MVGFTYDDEAYADPDLDAWLLEVGRLLREGREKPAKPAAKPPAKPAAKPPAKPAAKPPAKRAAANAKASKPKAAPPDASADG